MTSKTGNFKSFDKFCRMMYSSLESNNNGSVFIDLLTYQDLEILKSRKAAKSGQEPTTLNATQRTKNKRYLILTYVVEFDRVHYPLALKMDDSSVQDQNRNPNANQRASRKQSHERGAAETARKLLNASASSSQSSSSNSSSRTASPRSSANWRSRARPHKLHNQSTPNLNQVHGVRSNRKGTKKKQPATSCQSPNPPSKLVDNPNRANFGNAQMIEVMEENARLKAMVQHHDRSSSSRKSEFPSHKFSELIESLEDENKILKNELEKKNMEIRRITRSTKQYQKKHISKRLADLEDEVERVSTELLSERTKHRRLSREFQAERAELNKNIENLEASVDHFKRKCRTLKDEVNATKETLENVRLKASKQRLYASTKSLKVNQSTTSLRRSRSRNNNKRAPKSRTGRSNSRNNSRYYKQKQNSGRKRTEGGFSRPRSRSNSASRFQRSSSASRIQQRRKGSGSRSRSPSVRFDPTEWAKRRKDQIAKSKSKRNTFGKSRSPSPYRRTSRSVSPNRGSDRKRDRSNSRNLKKKRDRSTSRKRNSFGSSIPSKSPKPRESRRYSSGNINRKLTMPLHPGSGWRRDDNEELDVLNSMEKRQQRIMAITKGRSGADLNETQDTVDADDDEDDDESAFNPTTEIESIDSRLNALQKFLRAAKSTK